MPVRASFTDVLLSAQRGGWRVRLLHEIPFQLVGEKGTRGTTQINIVYPIPSNDGWMDGWMDGRMDSQIFLNIMIIFDLFKFSSVDLEAHAGRSPTIQADRLSSTPPRLAPGSAGSAIPSLSPGFC